MMNPPLGDLHPGHPRIYILEGHVHAWDVGYHVVGSSVNISMHSRRTDEIAPLICDLKFWPNYGNASLKTNLLVYYLHIFFNKDNLFHL